MMLSVFRSLGIHVPFDIILVVYSLSMSMQTIPLGIPAEVGFAEIVMTSLYTLLGVAPTISAAATILVRSLTVWLRLLIGYGVVQWLGVKILMGKS